MPLKPNIVLCTVPLGRGVPDTEEKCKWRIYRSQDLPFGPVRPAMPKPLLSQDKPLSPPPIFNTKSAMADAEMLYALEVSLAAPKAVYVFQVVYIKTLCPCHCNMCRFRSGHASMASVPGEC